MLQNPYDNVPAVGLLKNDLKLIAGIAYKIKEKVALGSRLADCKRVLN